MAKKPQIDKFREAARETEADASEENFDSALRGIAKKRQRPSGEQGRDDDKKRGGVSHDD